MSDDGDMWRELREERKRKRKKDRERRSKSIREVIAEFSVTLVEITPWQFRLSKEGFATIDYFPTSNKYTVVGSKKYQYSGKIEELLEKCFKNK